MADSELLDARSALLRFDATGPRHRRLFCLPFAGGGPATYRLWPKSLPSDVEVVAVQLPGRDPRSRQAPPGSVAEIVGAVHEAVAALHAQDPLPFAVFGHSMGSLIAFELTIAMERVRGASPSCLFVSGRRPPDELHRGEVIHGLADDAFLDSIQRSYGGVPEQVRNEPELLAMFLPALRADVQAYETYAPLTDHVVRCPVRVYGGIHDTHPRPSQLPGWQRVAENPIAIQLFEGDHFYLNGSREKLTAAIAADWPTSTASADLSSGGVA